jgi:Holliday junction DNA helicase RuvA
MLNSLRGTITTVGPGYVRLETAGVEWELEASAETVNQFQPGDPDARILVFLYHREDTMKLFGFATEAERRMFLELTKVDGIGPRQALRVLSGAASERLRSIVEEGDVEALSQLPGLGKKTAQKIVLALQGKLEIDSGPEAAQSGELVDALVAMGFDKKEAADALTQVRKDLGPDAGAADERERELLRRAIVLLS